MKIFKLFGLPESERLTLTVYPPKPFKPALPLDVFKREVATDSSRYTEVLSGYEMSHMGFRGVQVLSTLKRFRDEYARKYLVYYQAFFLEERNLVWLVRADISDDMALFKRYYDDLLTISTAEINP